MEDPSVNDDVKMEVLSRLSAKQLYASKCVSKGWNSLISDPSFLRMHSQRSKEISGFLVQHFLNSRNTCFDRPVVYICLDKAYRNLMDTMLDFLPEKAILMASSNGLLCCRSCIYPGEYSEGYTEEDTEEDTPRASLKRKSPSKKLVIYVCNPTTKEWIALRPTGCHVGDTIGLAFYPFGSSSNSNTTAPSFKLVSIQRSNNGRNTYSFVVYSSETRRWRTSKQVCHCNYEIYKNREIFTGQRFHWLTTEQHIITFDVERELSGVIKLPGPIMTKENWTWQTCLGDSEGYLHYVCVDSRDFKIWMLKDYFKPEWVLKYHLNMFDLCEKHPRDLRYLRLTLYPPLGFYEDVLFMNLDRWLYSYNFKTRTLKKHCPLFMVENPLLMEGTMLPYSVCLAAVGVLKEYRREGSKNKSNGDPSHASSPGRPKRTTRKPWRFRS